MMRNKSIRVIILGIIFSFSIIFSLPIVILSTNLATSGNINKTLQYFYNPSSSSNMEELNIDIDIGDVEIEYIVNPVNYYAKLDINIEMIGSGLAGKSYLDYFDFNWQNTSEYVNFTMRIKPELSLIEVLSLLEVIQILIFLSANVICDIDIRVRVQGDTQIIVPFGISVENIIVNLYKGDIQFDFSYCILKGNITGIIQDEGDLFFKSYNLQLNQNISLFLSTREGDIFIDIFQHNNMKANISGIISHKIGNIHFKYEDDDLDVGAYFILYYNPNDLGFPRLLDGVEGFDHSPASVLNVYYLKSYDYLTECNFNLLFNNSNGLFLELDLKNNY
ncbi:MAG: hypothetical protein ACFFBY_14200 [Promethearchaeota archaeon]